MSLPIYMDVHVRLAITSTLRARGIDVLTSQEDGTTRLPDPDLMDRATSLGRVLFSQDEDLLAEASHRQRSGSSFSGLVYAHQLAVTVRQCINDLHIIAGSLNPEEMANRVVFLPLK